MKWKNEKKNEKMKFIFSIHISKNKKNEKTIHVSYFFKWKNETFYLNLNYWIKINELDRFDL